MFEYEGIYRYLFPLFRESIESKKSKLVPYLQYGTENKLCSYDLLIEKYRYLPLLGFHFLKVGWSILCSLEISTFNLSAVFLKKILCIIFAGRWPEIGVRPRSARWGT